VVRFGNQISTSLDLKEANLVKTREGTPAHNDAPEPKKPYSAPRLVKYGDLRQLTRGSHGFKSDGGAGTPTKPGRGPCWIAEVLYGAEDPRTHLLRMWLVDVYSKTSVGSMVVAVYRKFGREMAALAKRSSLLRGLLRPVFEAGLVRAHRHFISSRC
jgi:hypothetical protein